MHKTKYETKYFSLAEGFTFQIDLDTGEFHFDELDNKLYKLFPKLCAEIRENSTVLTDQARVNYFETIKTRAIQMEMDIRFVKDKPGQFKYSYESETIIDPPFEKEQYIGFDKAAIFINGKEYPLGKRGVEARKQVLVKHKHILIQQINRFFPDLAQKSTSKAQPEKTEPSPKAQKKIPRTLKECFQSDEDYTEIMKILAEKKYIDSVNFRWIDKKEKGWKGKLCAFLKDIEIKGYLKDDIKINWSIAKAIIKNDFYVEISGNKTFYNGNLLPKETGIIPYCNKK